MNLKELLYFFNKNKFKTKVEQDRFKKLKSINSYKFDYNYFIGNQVYNSKEKVEIRILSILKVSCLINSFDYNDYKDSKYNNILSFLIDRGIINEIQAKNLIKLHTSDYKIILNLLDLNIINDIQMKEILEIQEETGKMLGEILIKKGILSETYLTNISINNYGNKK